jgi:5-methylcytosine-specific restriction endonuclease McrA
MMRSTRRSSCPCRAAHPSAPSRPTSRRLVRTDRTPRPVVRLTASAGASSRRPHVAAHVAAKQAMRRVALRDCGQRCVYCAARLDQRTATLDHVVPLAHGGAHDPGNLVTACGPCNRLKGDMLPFDFFARHPWAGSNFVRYARSVHRALKRGARRAVSLAFARAELMAA